MKLTLVSDYPFVKFEDDWYSGIPWDRRFLDTFAGKVDTITLVGRCSLGTADDVRDMHRIDSDYYEVYPMPQWSGLGFFTHIGAILAGLRGAASSCDGVVLKMFYVHSVLMFFVNRFFTRKPIAALLVGDCAKAVTMRKDLIPLDGLRSLFSRFVLGLTRHIMKGVTVPATVSRELREKYTARADAIVANESWIDEKDFCLREPHAGDNRFLFVGRLVPLKGVLDLLEAVGRLRDEGFPFHLTIVGDGPQRSELEERVRRLELGGLVNFTGWVRPLSAELFTLYRESDVLCLPSYSEGLPLVLIEALANSVPVVASRVNGIPEIIEHEKTGLLIEPGDVNGLATSIKRILTDTELRARCVKEGYETAKRNTYTAQRGYFGQTVAETFSGLSQ